MSKKLEDSPQLKSRLANGGQIASLSYKKWRGARVDDWGGLENRCGSRIHRGFESHPLRLK